MRKLLLFTVGFASAAAVYVYWLPKAAFWYVVGTAALVLLRCCFLQKASVLRLRIILFGLVMGLLWTWGYEAWHITPMRELVGGDTPLTVTVCEPPKPTKYGCSAICSTEHGRILVYFNELSEEPSLGDRLTFSAKVSDLTSGERRSLYYASEDVTLMASQTGACERLPADSVPFSLLPRQTLQTLREKMTEIFPEDTVSFFNALLTGERASLSSKTQNALSITGLSHVVAISGLHVSILTGIVFFLLGRRRFVAILSIPLLLAFGWLMGFTPSVTRAIVMLIVFLLAPVFERENDPPTSLALALLLILLCNPYAVASVRLQMSFAAVAGILTFSGMLHCRLLSLFNYKKWKRIWKRCLSAVLSLAAVSLSALTFTTPLTAYYFNTVSVISPISNLLTNALITLCFAGGLLACLLGLIYAPLGAALGSLVSWGARLFLWIAETLAKLPYAAVYTHSVYVVIWLVSAYLLFGLFLLDKRRRPALLAVMVAASFVVMVGCQLLRSHEASITAFDVGQGQCLLLESGSFRAMVDCGGDQGDTNGRETAEKLLMSGIRSLDYLILTHYDSDHVCGFDMLANRIEIQALLVPDISDENAGAVLLCAERHGIPVYRVTEDMTVNFEDGSLTIFAPLKEKNENHGLSALLCVENYDILVTGDMDAQGESLLVEKQLPDIEVLVAGHHGSKYSTGTVLLNAALPEVVLISVGENRYGHPSGEVLERISALGSQVYRTDECGDITVRKE